MSENKHQQDLSRYDALTTEELEQLLRADLLITDEDEEYLEAIVYIAEVYAKRKKNEAVPQPEAEQKPKRTSLKKLIGPIAAAAAIVALIFCGTFTAKSMGFDLWGAVAKWTGSLFTFDTPTTQPSDTDPLEVIERMKPTWLPEGFELVEEKTTQAEKVKYYALYENGDATIVLTYQESTSGSSALLEKNDEVPEEYERNGLTFYIFKNVDRIVAAWYTDGLVCHISGDISTDTMKTVIDSIGQA